MKQTAKDDATLVAETVADIPVDIYHGLKSVATGDLPGVAIAATSLFLPEVFEGGLK